MAKQVRSVLYVDDDVSSLVVMQILLVEELHLPYVTMFEDSDQFMQRVKALSVPPDVILLDIHVKPLTGFEMLRQLRENGFSEAVIIALTASVMNEEVMQLKTAGFDGVIAKPVNLDRFPKLWECALNGEQIWSIV
jgi:CheY-like chemotaxis protein